jgi:hypothetical protein
MPLKKIGLHAMNELAELLGYPAEGIIGIHKDGDRGWVVTVEMLEMERVPETTDVLGCYEVEVDDHGGVVGYRRVRRYLRAQVED